MRRLILAAILVAGCATTGARQTQGLYGSADTTTQVVVPTRSGAVPSGTTLWVRLDDRLSLDRSDVGDSFSATVTQDILAEDGELLVPAGATIIGHVAFVDGPRGDRPAVMRLALDELSIDGMRQPIAGEIVQTQVAERRSVRGRDVALGAAGGALLGAILSGGEWEGALIGGALGAGAGSLISLGTSAEAVLPEGSEMAIRLDRPVRSVAMLRSRYY